jgi:hypothetical protein
MTPSLLFEAAWTRFALTPDFVTSNGNYIAHCISDSAAQTFCLSEQSTTTKEKIQ